MSVPQELAGSSDPSLTPTPVAVRARRLRKEFELFTRPWDRLVQWGTLGRVRRGRLFVAVDDIDLTVAAGDAVGIVGVNGAGKSTLLKLICGVLYPSGGEVEVQGRLASLLELGTGFHPEFSGRANLVFNARFLGLHHDEIQARMDDIIAFADVGEFIDQPLRTYSTGMQLRLAFAVAAHTRPDVLVIDEALAVGDAAFTRKCIEHIRQFSAAGGTLLFATHDAGMLKSLCRHAILLEHGRVYAEGAPRDVLEVYNERLAGPVASVGACVREQLSTTTAPRRSGNCGALIRSVAFLGGDGGDRRAFISGEKVTVRVEVCFLTAVDNPTVGILIRDRLGHDVYGTNTHLLEVASGSFAAGETLVVSFAMRLELGAGEYELTVAAHTLDVHIHESYDWIDRIVSFRVLPSAAAASIGPACLHPRVVLERAAGPSPAASWSELLVGVFGAEVPAEIVINAAAEPWLFRGWYASEGEGDACFAWTRERFSFLIDLRGDTLEIEAGHQPGAQAPRRVDVRVWIFDHFLGAHVFEVTPPWSTLRVPVPIAFRQDAGVVTMELDGWSPRQIGFNDDDRTLGLQVRRLAVVQDETVARERAASGTASESDTQASSFPQGKQSVQDGPATARRARAPHRADAKSRRTV